MQLSPVLASSRLWATFAIMPRMEKKPVLIEEDGAFSTNTKQARRDEAEQAIKAIRLDAGKQKGVCEIFIPTFL